MPSQNDVCMTKRGCDDACANLIRSAGDADDDEYDHARHLSTRAPPTVAVTTPETEALSSSASDDNTAATTSVCCNGGSTGSNLVTVEYGRNEAVA